VLATLASRHDAAATVAVRQQEDAGRPVRGSMRWCSVVLPARQRRTEVEDVARPPSRIATVVSGSPAWSSAIPTG